MQWEYKTLVQQPDGPPIGLDKFNEMGAKGWELVSVFWNGQSEAAYFKRPLDAAFVALKPEPFAIPASDRSVPLFAQ